MTTPEECRQRVRTNTIRFGPPLFVPSPSFDDEWQVRGVNGGPDSEPSGILIFSGSRRGYLDVMTTTIDVDQPSFVEVNNIVGASISGEDISFPFSVTVSARQLELPVDDAPIEFQVLETGKAWRLKAVIQNRVLSAAGRGALPHDLAFRVVTEISSLPVSRFS